MVMFLTYPKDLCGTTHVKNLALKLHDVICLGKSPPSSQQFRNTSPNLTAYDTDARMRDVHVEISLSERVMLGFV